MSILPVALRRRLRASGFTEEQTDALDEASVATAEASRAGMATDSRLDREVSGIQSETAALRSEMRAEFAALRAEMQAMKWWLFGSLAMLILATTAAIIAAVAVWGG